MKIIDYSNDPRWYIHPQKDRECPNFFISLLLRYKDSIPDLEKISMAIETGTFEGDTAIFLSEIFDKVFTVEKFPENNPYTKKDLTEIYNEIKRKTDKIEFHFNNSPQFLKEILSRYPKERFFILLDAHTGRDTPVGKELDMIHQYSERNDHVIIIDDMIDAGRGNWPDVEEFNHILHTINKDYNIINTKLGRDAYLIY